ncbi:MAG TPA: GTP cyclohydrolase I FolE [Thermoanaerobaculia bacterium]
MSEHRPHPVVLDQPDESAAEESAVEELSAAEGALVPAAVRSLAARAAHREERTERLAHHVRGLLTELGLDLGDPNLRETDRRVARMYLEMFAGLEDGAEPKVTTFPNDEGYSHMVMEKEIPFYSMCAHHLVPFYGHAHIAYIPRERIMGLSKFARILEFYAKRPQLQERLTEQVVNYLEEQLKPLGAMVVIEARHLCVEMRGVKKPGVVTTTSAIRGIFHQRPVREEFLDLLRRPP